jgi:molecular chaperone GrpE
MSEDMALNGGNGEMTGGPRFGPDEARMSGARPADQQKRENVTLARAEYEELTTMAQERDEYLRRLQRAVADYQNLQKRIEKRAEMAREEMVRAVGEAILPLADSLARALEAAEQMHGGEDIVNGLELVEREYYDALAQLGIKPIEAAGKPFDPHYHDAMMQEPAEGLPPNTVVRELKKGFVCRGKVVRPSQVTVTGNGEGSQGGEGEADDR